MYASMNSWGAYIEELKEFYKNYGHSRVPYRYKENPELGRWVQKLRLQENKLTGSQKKQLNNLKFLWSSDIRKEKRKKWLLMFARLVKFQIHYGHCNVPSKYDQDPKLGRWVEVLRTQKGKLELWQEKKLAKIGFMWSDDIQDAKEKRWYQMYRRLEAFYQKFGHSDVPEGWDDQELAIWVICQRRPKKPLSAKRRNLLDLLAFSWNGSIGLNMRDKKGKFISRVKK